MLDTGETNPDSSLLSSNKPLVPSAEPVSGTSGLGADGHRVCTGCWITFWITSSPCAASAWQWANCVSKT